MKKIIRAVLALSLVACIVTSFSGCALLTSIFGFVGYETKTETAVNGVKIDEDGNKFTMKSGSMAPTINEGDYVIYEKVALENLKRGDIIVYCVNDDPELITAQRIVEIVLYDGEYEITVLGDAQEATGYTELDGDDVLGIVTEHGTGGFSLFN